MPGKIKVKILAGRNLPVMDRSGDTTDAYVEIKFSNTTYKTDVCRKSLNPQWNSEWYRFEVDDAELQDEPLQVRLMDHDTYSANDAIGKVYVNLNPLLLPGSPLAVKNIWTLEATMNSSSGSQGGSVMTGWIPVFDTMHGIRGEVNIIVKVELFSDCNKFRQSSCGVQFFYSPNIPHGYHAQIIHGFVEELVVSDDPEYKWIDKIRTPRASNEARQTLFFKLSGEVQRKIGLKALDLGGNAVIGYVQNFDLEGESGIVARGIGTAVTLIKLQDITTIIPLETSNIEDLTCFGLQSKNNPLECYESDDSLPLLSHSPNQTPVPHSPINLGVTTISQKFPKYERTSRHSHQAMRIAEYRAAGLRARQLSLQHSSPIGGSMRKDTSSSLSLVDDLISESSLKNMLALEDMRGEPAGNPFSRGLKNFRYLHQNILPKRVAQIKSKITDSLDDESDQESNYSSTWSLAGSESNRSSIADLRQSIRRKKFTHKKKANDGIAALLIRSVHSGFPLDSVIEDRETPAPSPVNFLTQLSEYSDESAERVCNTEAANSNETTNTIASSSQINENLTEKKVLTDMTKRDVKYTSELLIPMISSSETDTSTSDDDDDEPSESSTNYNILDETYSMITPSSPDETNHEIEFERAFKVLISKEIVSERIPLFGQNQKIEIVRSTEHENLSSQRDCSLESSTDYNILDDTCSLIDPNSLDANLETDFQATSEVTRVTGISKSSQFLDKMETSLEKSEDLESQSVAEKNISTSFLANYQSERITDYNILDDTRFLIQSNLPNDEKLPWTFRRDVEDTRFTEVSNISEPIFSIPMKNHQYNEIFKSERENSSLGRDCSLESSTDYNILDDTGALIDPDLPEDNINSDMQGTVEDSRFSEISNISGTDLPMPLKNHHHTMTFKTERENSSSQRDPSLESSTDYNILDDTCSLINPSLPEENLESDFHGSSDNTETTEISNTSLLLEKTERSLEKSEDLEIKPLEEKNISSMLLADFPSELSANYAFPDDTRTLINSSLPNSKKSPMTFQRNDQDTKLSEISNIAKPIFSISRKNHHQIVKMSEEVKIEDSLSKPNSLNDEKIENILQENSKDEYFPEVEAEVILSSPFEKIETLESIGAVNEDKFSSTPLTDENLNSSTDLNVLENTCSMIETSLINNEFMPILQQTINLSKISRGPELVLSSQLKKIETDSVKTEDPGKAPIAEDFFFIDENLDSSTDYNVLDDTHSLMDPSTFEDEKFMPIFQRATKTEKCPKIVDNSGQSLLTHMDKIGAALDLIQDIKTEFSTKKSVLTPISTSLINPGNESKSSSSPQSPPSSKLKHLKFLPKQQHFDSAEDVEFVTSTPVETEITPFADFSPTEKAESFELTTNDIQPIFPSSKTEKFDSSDSFVNVSLENCAILEKDICPLGVPIERITIAQELKTPSSISEKLREIEPIISNREPPPPSPRNSIAKREKTMKKIERTDTVIYKGPPKDRDKFAAAAAIRDSACKAAKKLQSARPSSPIPIIVAPPPEDHATRLQVPVIQTTNINVQSTFSPDEMKTQHFGSIGSRKFPLEEAAISERFNRKYRQHCILDLIKTIDAKMMMHHGHHERRDSTRSKQRKKRERINTSATPSPDSIHRTRQHKRRSKSRSPERQHVHARAQVSSLSTHSFPAKSAISVTNLVQDLAYNSSYENLSRMSSVAAIVLPKDSAIFPKENTISNGHNDNHNSSNNTKLDVEELTSKFVPVETFVPVTSNNDLETDIISRNFVAKTATVSLIVPKDSDHLVFKSHSAGSLECLNTSPIAKITNTPNTIDDLCVPCSQLTHRQQDEQPSSPLPPSSVLPSSLGSKVIPNNASATTKTSTAVPNMHRRSSDSDLSITPKGNSLAGSDRSMGGHLRPSTAIVRTMNQDTMEMLEYPFITMQQYPPGFVLNIGGLVSARSVKLLERITNLEEPEGRDAWWTEIRMEVRSHARALACNVVLGYKEEISICDDVCVLNASGTAAVINLLNASQDQDNVMLSRTIMTTSVESERDKVQVKASNVKSEKNDEVPLPGQQTHSGGKLKRTSESNDHEIPYLPTLSACSLCHLPYNEASVPFRVDVSKCSICRRAKVPDVLFTTIELPENIPMTGRGVFLQATVCKCKRDLRGELNAKEISDCLPFLEYELHSLLLNKLKVKGMNAIFGLKVQVSVGERLVIGMAVGTAVYLTALPTPSVPKIASGNSWHNEEQLAEIQKTLIETVKKNREFYRLKPIADVENGRSITTSDTDESDDDLPDLDLGIGTKDACVLEVDDVEDMDRINLLIDEKPPDDFHVVNTQSIPGLEDLEIVRNLQMFTQISRAKIPAGQFASMPSKYFARMVQTVLFKLRRMVPCALCDMQFKVALPEQDEIQLSVVGMALGLGEPTRFSKYKRKIIPNSSSKDPVKRTDEADLIFSLDEDQVENTMAPQESMTNQSNANISCSSPLTGISAQKHRPRSPFRTRLHMQHRPKHVPLKERYGVDITPLSYLPGGKIERYLGNLNFFFIRESTSIRENGGLSGFTHSFVTEILAIVRAHITALGGNAMVAFFMTQCVLLHSPHKNQGQCLINVGGDVVTVSYYGDDKHQGNQNC